MRYGDAVDFQHTFMRLFDLLHTRCKYFPVERNLVMDFQWDLHTKVLRSIDISVNKNVVWTYQRALRPDISGRTAAISAFLNTALSVWIRYSVPAGNAEEGQETAIKISMKLLTGENSLQKNGLHLTAIVDALVKEVDDAWRDKLFPSIVARKKQKSC